MKKYFLKLMVLILFVSTAYSQNTFEINFGTSNKDIGYSIQPLVDGKYIVAGSTGSFASDSSDVYLALIDTNGSVLWTKAYGGVMNDAAYCVRQTPDSGFMVTGVTYSYGNGLADVYLLKLNPQGDTLWTKTFGGTNYDMGLAVQVTFDGGYIVTGQDISTGGGVSHIYMIRTDANGDSLWTQSYPLAAWASARGIVQTPDSGFLVFGDFENNTGFGDYDLVCIKTDSMGIIQWTHTYDDSDYHDYAQAIRATSDNGFVIAGTRESVVAFELESSKILRLDSNGDTLWTKAFGITYNYTIGDIFQTPDSGFVITGHSYDTTLLVNVLLVTKINLLGDSLWTRYFNGLYSASGNSIEGTADNGIVVCGETSDSALSLEDVYILKLDANGNFYPCQALIIIQPMDSSIFENTDALFSIVASPQTSSYQWQIDSAGIFVDIADGGVFTGSTSDTLRISGATLLMDGNLFRCIVIDSLGCSEISNVVSLSVSTSIGVTETQQGHYEIYPNPSPGSISLAGQTYQSALLFDIYGKVIKVFGSEVQLDVSFLAKGVYFLRIFSNAKNSSAVYRFIKY